ncbi:hypothetical protein LTS08_008837 [Lithohypha guttulata]|uniref:Uncharacterized protein n=1 Tax=Lithohypha guttulata TaxID=1690604 RepID=A0ABR0K3F4_9EURO|nr:hypothetical protein LTR24_007948 [Lithohypha guttulata]KAK5093750.1 hypothetical protein LTS08_008837 [Lithohypha guttulata]KAK5313375.1 hypothetical protein LTR70_007679 [Exophiala xenobiotica]
MGGPQLCGLAAVGCVTTSNVSTLGLCKIALGFDFIFNPMCILEDSSLDNESEDVWDWSSVFADNMEWDEISEGSRVYRKKTHDGRWALKGHRLYGLDVLLSAHFSDRGSLVTMKRGESKLGLIWEFDIDELIGPFRSLQPEALREAFGNRRDCQESYGLGMTGEGLEEGDELLKVLFPAMRSLSMDKVDANSYPRLGGNHETMSAVV